MLGQLRARRRLQGQGRGVPQAGVAPGATAPGDSPMPAGMQSPLLTPGLTTPYDYGAKFGLTGVPGNTLEDVVNISPEGAFVATAIGYGFHENRGRELELKKTRPDKTNIGPDLSTPSATFQPGDLVLENIPPQALIEGFRLHPDFLSTVLNIQGQPSGRLVESFRNELLPKEFADRVLEWVKPPTDNQFFYSIMDSGTGRELQDEPVHSLASIGKSNGERPFRPLARPLLFLPRSTIRVQVIEATEGAQGTLFIVLYGYKVLGVSGCPESAVRGMAEAAMRAQPPLPPSDRVIPFDYVAGLNLTGIPRNFVEEEIPIHVGAGFVATALGYALLPEERDVSLPIEKIAALPQLFEGATVDPLNPAWASQAVTKDFSQIPLRLFPESALRDGMRIRPGFLRMAFGDNGKLQQKVTFEIVNMIFERLNRAEDVSFLFTVFDAGTGRELQNMFLDNISGLGIANGDRPFKTFARPMFFQPRSVIRVSVQENYGRGKLFFVFQGFKLLGSGGGGA